MNKLAKLRKEIKEAELEEQRRLSEVLESSGLMAEYKEIIKPIKINYPLVPGFVHLVGDATFDYSDGEYEYNLECKYVGPIIRDREIMSVISDMMNDAYISDISQDKYVPKDMYERANNFDKLLMKIAKMHKVSSDDLTDTLTWGD